MADQLTPRPTPLPPPSQAAVEAVVLGEGWEHAVDYQQGGWITSAVFDSKGSLAELEYQTFSDHRRVVLHLGRSLFVLPSRRAGVRVLLNWINTTFHCCTYVLHDSNGEVRLRVSLAEDLGAVIDAESVTLLTYLALSQDERYSASISEVAEGRRTAAEVMACLTQTPS